MRAETVRLLASEDDGLAGRALAQAMAGDASGAYPGADRQLRLATIPEALLFLVRAEVLSRLGESKLAAADAREVLALDPGNVEASRLLLQHGTGEDRRKAAAALAAQPETSPRVPAGLAALREAGERFWAHSRVEGGALVGWAVWTPGVAPSLMIRAADSTQEIALVADPSHPLARCFGAAASWRVPAPDVAAKIAVVAGDEVRGVLRAPIRAAPSVPALRGRDGISIIIPVYDDLAATRRCIDSVLSHRPDPSVRIILVEDESPDPALVAYLAELEAPGLEVLRNPVNLGFVGSVNRAIDAAPDGDILLLNADTVVPPRFLERLRAAAYSAPDIGTVIPLSNNGEYVSLPVPFVPNDLGTNDEVHALDRAAEAANAGKVVDLPSGIGFCLYITARCLDDVPRLSEGWGRGYLEDVDYSLRAADKGWRNVCAAGVFVGHAGSRSFKDDKRALVVSNARRLAGRFPAYRAGYISFLNVDPLREVRAALESALDDRRPIDRLIVSGPKLAELAQARAEAMAADGAHVVAATVSADGKAVRLKAANGAMPQSLSFEFAELTALLAYLDRHPVGMCEVVGLEPMPRALWDILPRIGRSPGLFTADLRHAVARRGVVAEERSTVSPRAMLRSELFRRVEAADDVIAGRLRGLLPDRLVPAPPFRPFAGDRAASGTALLVVMPVPDGPAHALTRDMVVALRVAGRDTHVVIAGRTLDDRSMMSLPGVHVTGAVEPEEIGTLARLYRAGHLVLPDRFASGHALAAAAARLALPFAYFAEPDYRQTVDLRLAPESDAAEAVARIVRWIAARPVA